MSSPLIAGIICTHNREKYLAGAIDSLLQQDLDKNNYEVIVVDNASTDSTAEICQKYSSHPNFKYVYESTLGLSVARNAGAKSTTATILAYLDDDAEASTQWLRVLTEAYQNNSQLAIAGGKVELKLPGNYENLPNWISEGLSGALGFYNLGNEIIYITEPGLTPRGLNYSIKKDFLEDIGGFDANFGRVGTRLISNEELVMTELALEKGRQVAYIPEAEVLHNVQPERLKRDWFLRRSWWQGVSEYQREAQKKSSKTSQLAKGGERIIRGLYKSLKNINQPDISFENLLYAYGQLGYFSSVFGMIKK